MPGNYFDQFDERTERGFIPPMPESAGERADRERNDAAAGRDTTKTNIAVRDEQRNINKQRYEQTRGYRSDFEGMKPVKDYRTIIAQYAAGVSAGDNAAGDQKLINAYAQMLNPTSTVMLGEYQATEDPLKSTVFEIQQRLKKEFGWDGVSRIPETGRRWIRGEMQGTAETANQAYSQQRAFYSDLAARNGFDPYEIIGPHAGAPYLDDIERRRLVDHMADKVPDEKFSEELNKRFQRGDTAEQIIGFFNNNSRPVDPAKEDEVRKAVANRDGGGAVRFVPPDEGPQDYRNSYLGQGMSGVNESIAGVVGGPVDLVTAGLNLVPRGINALANTDIPQIENPLLGSQWFKDNVLSGTIYDQTNDPSKQFVRRVGESVGASLIPAGIAGSLPKAGAAVLAGVGGGIGGAGAQQAFPDSPIAEMGGEMVGSGLTGMGMFGAARRNAQRKIEAQIPTVPQLKDQAGNLYRQAEARGVTARPTQTRALARDMRAMLRQDGRVSPTGRLTDVYPKAKEGMQLIDDYSGKQMTPTEMNAARKVIAEGMSSADASERRLGSMMTDTFDTFANPLAPEFPQARDIASRYLTAEKLEQARELAGARAGQFSGSGFENALRTEYRGLDRSAIKGNQRFNADVTGAIENVSRGTPASNIFRGLGRLAPTGVVSGGLGTLLPGALAGAATGSPGIGAAVGGTMAGVGMAGRKIAENMGVRNADIAELTARNGGALPEPMVLTPDLERLAAAYFAAQAAKYLPGER